MSCTKIHDTLRIEVVITANCCASFLGEIQIKNDTTLNILYTEYGDECFCHCSFNIIYTIVAKENKLNSYELNGTEIIESDSIFDKENIGIIQELEYYENGNIKNKTFIRNNDTLGRSYYDENGAYIRHEKYKNE